MQDDVFAAMPHNLICDNMTVNISGNIRTEIGTPIDNVDLELVSVAEINSTSSDLSGNYDFSTMPFCDLEELIPYHNDNPLEGVTTFDIILIQKHILGIESLDSPFKMIAADVNKSGTISTIDIIRIRKLILGIETEFSDNTSWRFVWAGYSFEDVANPLLEDFAESVDFESTNLALLNDGFIAVKTGDVNNSAQGSNFEEVDDRGGLSAAMQLSFFDRSVEAGEEIHLSIQAQYLEALAGFQFELNLQAFDLLNIDSELENSHYHDNGEGLRFSWNNVAAPKSNTETLCRLHLVARKKGMIGELLELKTDFSAETYNLSGEALLIQLAAIPDNQKLSMEQNHPNPFKESTSISYYNPQAQHIHFTITDVAGRTVMHFTEFREKGEGRWIVDAANLPAKGYYIYELATSDEVVNRKMLTF